MRLYCLDALAREFDCSPRELARNSRNWICKSAEPTTFTYANKEQFLRDTSTDFEGEDVGNLTHLSCKKLMLELELRIGARVMVTSNYDQRVGVVNGTVGKVAALTNDTVYLRLSNYRSTAGHFETVRNERGELKLLFPVRAILCTEMGKLRQQWNFYQIPLKMCMGQEGWVGPIGPLFNCLIIFERINNLGPIDITKSY